GAKREVDALARMAEELREPVYLNIAELLHASLDILEGRFEEADRRLVHARGVAHGAGFLPGRQAVGALVFMLRKFQGRLAEIVDQNERTAKHYPGSSSAPAWWAARAAMFAEVGREPEARRLFESLAQREFTDIPRGGIGWKTVLGHLSELCALLGDAARARLLYGLLQ